MQKSFATLTTICYLILFYPSVSSCQDNLPQKVEVKFYLGGDYQDRYIKGVFKKEYTTVLKYDETNQIFRTNQILNTYQVYERNVDDFGLNALVRDSTLSIYDEIEISFQHIVDLLNYSDLDQYSVTDLVDTFNFDKTNYIIRDTALVVNNLSLKNYNMEGIYFTHECELYRYILSKDIGEEYELNCDSLVNDSRLLDFLIKTAHSQVDISSYLKYISIRIISTDSVVEYIQMYPGKINTCWSIQIGKKPPFKVINPKINDIISQFLPIHLTPIDALNEYKDIRVIVRSYLSSFPFEE